jgi:hypothetical protein
MTIVNQYATAEADDDGNAVFVFPDVPQGQVWSGTTILPGAPATFSGMVSLSGVTIGAMAGPGTFGPWTCGYSQKLAISAAGLSPGMQYQAVWHADVRPSGSPTDYPAAVATSIPPILLELYTPVTAAAGHTTELLPFQAGPAMGPYYVYSWGVTDLAYSATPPAPGLILQAGFLGDDFIVSPIDALNITGYEQWSDRPGGISVPTLWVTNNSGADYDIGVVYALVNP